MSKNFLVTDLGQFPELANHLAKGGENNVRYFTEWVSSWPSFSRYAIGKDFGSLEKVLHFKDPVKKNIEWADCIVNFDVHNNDEIADLRERFPDKSIFGSGKGMILENDRWFLRELTKEIGIPQQRAHLIKGMPALEEHLKKYPDSYVKMNIFRADAESFYVKDYKTLARDTKLEKLYSKLGMHADEYEFIVEGGIDAPIEIGFDGFFNGTDYVGPYVIGYEYHKKIYLGRVYEKWSELPECVQFTMDGFAPYLEEMKYRGALSTEEKIKSMKEHYFLDWCSRVFSPGSGVYKFIQNWDEVVYEIGRGEDVEIKWPYKYVAALPLTSREVDVRYLLIDIDKKYRDNVVLQSCTQHKDSLFAVPDPDYDIVAVVIGGGDTIDEALNMVADVAAHVHADGLSDEGLFVMKKCKELAIEGRKLGVDF